MAKLLLTLTLWFFSALAFSQTNTPNAVANYDCSRQCLYQALDRYLQGMLAKDPTQIP